MQKWTNSNPQPVRISLLLFDRFSNLCLANCIEPLRAANTLAGRTEFDWSILTLDGLASRSSSGIDILPQSKLSEMVSPDYLFVLASYGHEDFDTSVIRKQLATAARKADTIAAFDAAPWLLASAGLLEGRRATVHWDLTDSFAERFLQVDVERARILRDGPFITCAGAMSALDLTLDLIAAHLGVAMRMDVETLFIHGDPPVKDHGPAHQMDPLVAKALETMRTRIERPVTLVELAAKLSCQPRTLERRFRTKLGAPPGTVYRHIRLAEARKLAEQGQFGVAEIAVRCGYDSPAALSRAMKRHYGKSPRQLRGDLVGQSKV